MQAVQTVAEVHVWHPLEHASQEPEFTKYPEEHVVHVFTAEHAAQLRGQQAPLTNTWVEAHVVQLVADVQAVHGPVHAVHVLLLK